ncbi:MAG: HlyC/CorC family transporter [Chloroflexi bacterium]|nr:MAG: HlyC/CorC family transporter [Chloroflexota bacterium]MBL1193767.1 HlyC/CorC family transporter [Chloroflexota bacterium]NOH11060.1 HlyC/CorC family transporter [Chloroflexota bacterium]
MTAVLIPIGIISILIFLNGLFVAAEFAIVAAPRTRISQRAEEGSGIAKRVLLILLDPARQNSYLATAQVGITIVSLGLGMYGEEVLAEWLLEPLEHYGGFGDALAHTLAAVIAVAILTYLHVVLGEMIPKSLALQASERTVLALNQPMTILGAIFSPAVWLLNNMANAFTRLIGIRPPESEARLLTPQELEFIVEESSEGGLLEASDQLFFENILDLQERTVEQVMTSRTHIVGIQADDDLSSTLELTCSSTKTRYPVYEDGVDNIIGVIHIKDIARNINSVGNGTKVRELLRPTTFIPETLSLHSAVAQFRRENLQIAIVLDEYGGTAGIVTLEDLVEEVVGEIQDEFDSETTPIQIIDKNTLRVRGDVILDEINQLHDTHLSHTDAQTIGGLAMALLGRIPEPGDHIKAGEVRLEVESIKRFAVESLLVFLPQEEDGKKESEET